MNNQLTYGIPEEKDSKDLHLVQLAVLQPVPVLLPLLVVRAELAAQPALQLLVADQPTLVCPKKSI